MRKLILVASLVILARHAAADPSFTRDGAIIAGATATALVVNFLPFHEERPLRDHEWLAIDDRVRDNYSPRASVVSDTTLALSVVLPAAYTLGTAEDAETRKENALLVGESVALTLAATSLTKVLVARPRPYTYSKDLRAMRKVETAGRDAYRSFFSGHAAIAFAAASASGLLANDDNRALVLGSGAFLAASTANLRVRAGKHFYSDVVIGAAIGTAIGTLVPVLSGEDIAAPSGVEWASIGGGLALGVIASQLVPLGQSDTRIGLAPLLVRDGGGIALGGTL
jgi:hypothetical protein